MAGVPPPGMGRGRGMTLPAWMKSGGNPPGMQNAPSPPNPNTLGQVSSAGPPSSPAVGGPPRPQAPPSGPPYGHPFRPNAPPPGGGQQYGGSHGQHYHQPVPLPPSNSPSMPPASSGAQYSQPPKQQVQPPPQYPMPPRMPVPPPSQPSNYAYGQYRPGPYGAPPAAYPNSQTAPPSVGQMANQVGAPPSATPPVTGNPMGAGPPVAPGPPGPAGPPLGLPSDWQEHTAQTGRKYYYNKRTGQSSWEKPSELMTQTERADASTVWKEFTTPEGRKYYYNKLTKESKWTMPPELKEARESASATMSAPPSSSAVPPTAPAPAMTSSSAPLSAPEGHPMMRAGAIHPSPISHQVSPAVAGPHVSSNPPQIPVVLPPTPMGAHVPVPTPSPSPSLSLPVSLPPSNTPPVVPPTVAPTVFTPATTLQPAVVDAALNPQTVNPMAAGVSSSAPAAAAAAGIASGPAVGVPSDVAAQLPTSNNVMANGASASDIEEAKKSMPSVGKINITPVEDTKPTKEEEPLNFSNKMEAKIAFKELLESVHCSLDWTWEQAMKVIIHDKRYGALKTLGERRQAFNEYLAQRKKAEAEEKRLKYKKAREDFLKMLEESKELTSSMRWSKAMSLFEADPRLKALDRDREKEELYEDYLVDLERKEKEKAKEQRKKNQLEFRLFLESCDYIKVNTQWRKVQDKLEDDERCARLDKIDRLEVFQEYIRDLEKKEEEDKQQEREAIRRKERKNRDAFRKLLEDQKASAELNAKTRWKDFLAKVKDEPAYMAVASNTGGSTPKELFEDTLEELENQYQEDKSRVKELMRSGKISVTASSTLEKFQAALAEAGDMGNVSDVSVKLYFEDLLERVREKEEKENKKRRRDKDDHTDRSSKAKKEEKREHEEEKEKKKEREEDKKKDRDEERGKDKEKRRDKEPREKEKEKEKEKDRERDRDKEKDREREKDKSKDKEREKRKEKERDEKKEKERKKEREAGMEEAGKDEGKKREKNKDRSSKDVVEKVHGTGERERTGEKERDVSEDERKENGDKGKEIEKDKGKDREREKKHRKRHRNEEEEEEEGRSKKRHEEEEGDDGKKARKYKYDDEDDDREERKPRKHAKSSDHRKPTRKNASDDEVEAKTKKPKRERRNDGEDEEDLEDGEVDGEDGEIR